MPAILCVCEPVFAKTSWRWKVPDPAPAEPPAVPAGAEALPGGGTAALPPEEAGTAPGEEPGEAPEAGSGKGETERAPAGVE